jgi:hypothetical protein
MTKTNRIIFKIAAIISAISALFTLLIAIALLFNVKPINNIYYEIYLKSIDSTENNINFYKMISILNLFFSTLINRYCSKLYFSIARVPDRVRFGNLNSLLGLALFQLLLGNTFLPGIFCIIGVIVYNVNIKKHGIQTIEKNKRIVTKAILKDMASENGALKSATLINIPQEVLASMTQDINKIKQDLSKGIITQEEYMKKLNLILEGKKYTNN